MNIYKEVPMNVAIGQIVHGEDLIRAIMAGTEVRVDEVTMNFDRFLREPWPRQQQHIQAAVAGLLAVPKFSEVGLKAKGERARSMLFDWGMSAGKTTGAIIVSEILSKELMGKHGRRARKTRFNVAVSLPPTIIEKWVKEFGKVLQTATYRVVVCLDAQSAYEVVADLGKKDVTGLTYYLFPDTMLRRHNHVARMPLTGMKRNIRTAVLLDELTCKRTPKSAKILEADDLETLSSGVTRKKKGASGILPDGNKNKKTDWGKLARCPECGEAVLWKKVGADGNWAYLTQDEAKNDKSTECPHCGRSWLINVTTADSGIDLSEDEDDSSEERGHMLANVISPAYVFKKMRSKGDHKTFDLYICDEFHRGKGKGIHNKTISWMMNASDKTLALTGTLTGGRARDLHRLLYMINPMGSRRLGITWDSEKSFTDRFGAHVTTTTTLPDGKMERSTKTIAGTSSKVYSALLADRATFIYTEELEADGSIKRPRLEEQVVLVEMVQPEMVDAYRKIEEGLRRAIATIPSTHKSRYGAQACAANILNSWPDSLAFNTFEYAAGELKQVLQIDKMDVDLTDKEYELCKILRKEVREDRKSLVFVNYSDCGPRLMKTLISQGFNAAFLTSQRGYRYDQLQGKRVSILKREEWLAESIAAGVDVVICNPELVKEGLDLIDFQNIISYQATLNIYTWLQSLRRVYRHGNMATVVRHYFMAYAKTAQEITERLVADKVNSALIAEGNMADTAILELADKASADSIMRQLIQAVLESDPTLQYRSAISINTTDISGSSEQETSKVVMLNVEGIPMPIRVITRPAILTRPLRVPRGLYHPNQLTLFDFVSDEIQHVSGAVELPLAA